MTTLFRRLQPAKKFRISVSEIAQLLKIPKHKILRVECWEYVIFVHRRDKGGQFISYRQLRVAKCRCLSDSKLFHLATTALVVACN